MQVAVPLCKWLPLCKADIEGLLGNKVMEGRTLEYKVALPGGGDDDKREFLADVSSFANASGGDLIFGVAESAGAPAEIPGVATHNPDGEKLRLEDTIRGGIAPRIIGIQMRAVDGFSSGPVLVVRIPRSFASPHVVTFKNYSRFFTRSSAGKYQMDVAELRAAFEVSGALAERLQRFRMDRLAKIVAGETPVPIPTTAKMILHILPFSSFSLASYVGMEVAGPLTFRPMGTSGWDHRINVDGFLTYSRSFQGGSSVGTYCQFFRTGAIESVTAQFVIDHEGRRFMGSAAFERDLVNVIPQYLQGLKNFGVPPPLLITLSMVGVKGVELSNERRLRFHVVPIDRDSLLLPDVLIEQYEAVDAPKLMRPIFDSVWNACGFERSFNYDKDGRWNPT